MLANNTSFVATTASSLVFDDATWNSPYSVVVQVVVWICVAAISLETIVGNAMVIMAYKIERNISKQVSNRYIVSLAISDLIIGIEGFPLFTVYVLNGERWPLGSVTCETWLFLDYTLCLVSILTVLLITADRYLSVCHTAKYLKWQSPTKAQMTIFASWIIPAVIFGIMIYGWSAITGNSQSMSGSECSAPFLTNPYVNMGMYVAYYWTTLVAMLILYKGIHQAAKNLEKKAKAKERRHIALILSQRLGTQVGVSLMLQSRKEREEAEARAAAAVIPEEEEAQRDSGYHTTAAVSGNGESEQNLAVIQEEEKSSRRSSRVLPDEQPPPSLKTDRPSDLRRQATSRSASNGSIMRQTSAGSRRSSRRSGTGSFSEDDRRSVVIVERPSSVTADHKHRPLLDGETPLASGTGDDSLSLLFNEDDMSSVLQFKTSIHQMDSSNADSNRSSIIVRHPRKFHKSSHARASGHRSSSRNGAGVSTRIARRHGEPSSTSSSVRRSGSQRCRVVIDGALEGGNTRPGTSTSIRRLTAYAPANSPAPAGWFTTFRLRFNRAFERRVSTSFRDRSYSLSSTSSSAENEHDIHADCSGLDSHRSSQAGGTGTPALAPPRSETLLSPGGVSRKISSISAFTRERMITSIFGPIINRGRKPTKAEKRAHKAFRTITFIVGFFAILWSPYYVMATVYGFCKGECIPSLLYTLSYYMCYLNSSGNPFAYALANRQFRSAFIRMLKGNFNTVV